MAINHKVWNFPTFPISKQLFHVPGAAVDGGLTSGGARIVSPEPGGFSVLEIQPALQIGEWDYPLSSWLMSKGNGQILRVRLAPTPQVAGRGVGTPWRAETIYPETPWSNMKNWSGDIVATFSADSLEGSGTVTVDLSDVGPILRQGHVIGHESVTYLVDEIDYDGSIATINVIPPLRRNIKTGDLALFRPYFTGSIVNAGEFRNTYDAENVGMIQLNKIILTEVILP